MTPFYSYSSTKEVLSLIEKKFSLLDDFKFSPHIIFSDELRNNFDFGIDGLMGLYNPVTRSISIFNSGIARAEQELRNKFPVYETQKNRNLYSELLKIVIIHEVGHWMFHNVDLATGNMSEGKEKIPFAPIFLGDMVDEWIAQSFTYLCIKDIPDLKETLLNSTKLSPPVYKTFTDKKYKQYLGDGPNEWINLVSYLQYFKKKIEPNIISKQLDKCLEYAEMLVDVEKYNL